MAVTMSVSFIDQDAGKTMLTDQAKKIILLA